MATTYWEYPSKLFPGRQIFPEPKPMVAENPSPLRFAGEADSSKRRQILDGAPPANSPPVRVEATPGSRYAYSGGGFEIVQAVIEAATKMNFQDAVQDLLLRPAGLFGERAIERV